MRIRRAARPSGLSCFARKAALEFLAPPLVLAIVVLGSTACNEAMLEAGTDAGTSAPVVSRGQAVTLPGVTPDLGHVYVPPRVDLSIHLPRISIGDPCRTFGPERCADLSFCLPDACGSTHGICTAYGDCDPNSGAVCGCDGKTYQNQCAAYRAKVRVDADGACAGDPCAGCGATCEPTCGAGAVCSDAQTGVCIQQWECCTDDGGPAVCGCDGKWYATACDALRAGTSPGWDGCEASSCSELEPCDDGEYCRQDSDGLTCVQIPHSCADDCDDDEPVCVEGGTWYPSACKALLAGKKIIAPELCAPPPLCTACNGPDEYWMPQQFGACCTPANPTDAGTCAQRPDPQSCSTKPTREVCGCDGNTYANQCYAAAAGVTVNHTGPCIPPPCTPGIDPGCACPGDCLPDQVDVACGPEVKCVERPETCSEQDAPVCGCNGITYHNECIALQNGVGVWLEGPCPCGRSGECSYPDQVCTRCRQDATCIDRPTNCSADPDAVCGCDGQTYRNECIALQHGVEMDYEGPCRCGGKNGLKCNYPREVCDLCEPGSCVAIIDGCGDDYDPVCGCDGKTYDNECEATRAGVSSWIPGCCEPG